MFRNFEDIFCMHHIHFQNLTKSNCLEILIKLITRPTNTSDDNHQNNNVVVIKKKHQIPINV